MTDERMKLSQSRQAFPVEVPGNIVSVLRRNLGSNAQPRLSSGTMLRLPDTPGQRIEIESDRGNISCMRCGEPWDAYRVFASLESQGDMTSDEAKMFFSGMGCPNCELEPPSLVIP